MLTCARPVTDAGYRSPSGSGSWATSRPRPAAASSPPSSAPFRTSFGAAPAKFEERGREVQGFLTEGSRQIGARGQAAKGRAEDQVRATVTRVQGLGGIEVAKIVEPVVAPGSGPAR